MALAFSIRTRVLLLMGVVFIAVIGGGGLYQVRHIQAQTARAADLDDAHGRYEALHAIRDAFEAGRIAFHRVVLRGDSVDRNVFEGRHALLLGHVARYRDVAGLTEIEAAALDSLIAVAGRYRVMSGQAVALHRAGTPVAAIDAALGVDDAPAMRAVQTLQASNAARTAEAARLMTTSVRDARRALLIGSVLLGGVLLGIAYVLIHSLLRPILALKRAAQNVAEGDLDTRVSIDGYDELGELGVCFNEMTLELERLLADVQAEKAKIEASEHLLRRVGEVAGLGGWAIRVRDRAVYWTPEVFHLHDLDVGTPPTLEQSLAYYPTPSRWVLESAVECCLSEGIRWDLELQMKTHRGDVRWVRSVGEIEPTGAHVTGILQDITARKQAELDHADTHLQLRAILDGTTDAIAAVDPSQRYTAFNDAYSRIVEQRFGRRPVVGMEVGEALPLQTETQRRVHMQWDRAIRGESFRQTVEDGDVLEGGTVYEVAYNPIRNAVGKVVGAVSVMRDVSERVRVERLKSEFISVVNHELRTPLTSLSGALAMLKGGAFGEISAEAAPMLDLAARNATRLGYLIGDLLDLQKVQTGMLHLTYRRMDLQAFLDEVLERNRPLEAKHGVRFVLMPDLPEADLYGDDARLHKVMEHVLSNAAKFSAQGGRVELSAVVDDDQVSLRVRDDGPGIPLAFHPYVFEPFRQGDASTMRRYEGSGVGLSLCKRIIEEHGGTIRFETALGEGTTFHILLPILVDERRNFGLPLPAGASILICEDDRDAALTLQARLNIAGFKADVALCGDEANRCLREQDYDLITLDLKLPDANGLALLHDWRQDERTRDIPVLIISGYLDEETCRSIPPASGRVSFMSKPLDQRLLVNFLNNAVMN